MNRPRDTQRQRVYDAERVLRDHGEKFATVFDMQQYVNRLTRSAWWKNRYPRFPTVSVEDGRGRRRPCATFYGSIKMPRWCRFEAMVLHELAHVVDPKHWTTPAHGREFTQRFYELVRWQMGDEAAVLLLASFREHRVKVGKRMPTLKTQTAQAVA